MDMPPTHPSQAPRRSNTSLACALLALVAGMVMLSFAAVPLYRLFCQVTGFGGTPMQADAAPGTLGSRPVTVDFNADTDPHLPWEFTSMQRNVELIPGKQTLVFFTAANRSHAPVSGTAVFNVTPHKAAPYFQKLECFCYEEQRLAPGEEVVMPVSFFIDPEIENDPQTKDVHTITLSYTFFKTKQPTE